MLDETRLEGLALLADQDALNALIDTQVILQRMVKKNLVSPEEVALTRELVKRQPKYKQMQQTLDDAMDRVDESSKLEFKEERSVADKKIKIVYRDGTEEQVYVDDYYVRDGCFCTYVRFGVESGSRHIPLDRIREYIVY